MQINLQSQKRIILVDVIRGFALFGVLISNTLQFAFPEGQVLSDSKIDQLLANLVRIFVEGSFYPLFAFLFGFGLAIQLSNPNRSINYVHKRLQVLVIFGLVHAVFIWFGDILLAYAVLGFLPLAFRKKSNKVVLSWVASLLVGSVLIYWGLFKLEQSISTDYLNELTIVYGSGSYLSATLHRLEELVLNILTLPLAALQLLPFFLLGWLAHREGYLSEAQQLRKYWKRILFSCLGVTTLIVLTQETYKATQGVDLSILKSLEYSVASPSLGFVYLAAILLSYSRIKRYVNMLAAVGRMSLSNYLAQSVIMTLIFYSYGLGFYNSLPLGLCLLIAILLFLAQLILSHLWLRYYSTGPIEWLWRTLIKHSNALEKAK